MSNCLNCGKPMEMRTVVQLYCSRQCQQEYYRAHKRDVVAARWPSITFTCAKCGRTITTAPGTADRRTRFCSVGCEKKYWRHPPQDSKPHNQTFHSVSDYAAYERRTNEI